MVRKGYRNCSIPEKLYEELETYVEKSNGKYVSIAETVREAIREFLEKEDSLESVVLVLFSERDFQVYLRTAKSILT